MEGNERFQPIFSLILTRGDCRKIIYQFLDFSMSSSLFSLFMEVMKFSNLLSFLKNRPKFFV